MSCQKYFYFPGLAFASPVISSYQVPSQGTKYTIDKKFESANDIVAVAEDKEVTLHSTDRPQESNQFGRGDIKQSVEEAFNNPVMCQTEVLPKAPKRLKKVQKSCKLSKIKIE